MYEYRGGAEYNYRGVERIKKTNWTQMIIPLVTGTDGYQSALIDFGFVAYAVFTYQEVLKEMTVFAGQPVG